MTLVESYSDSAVCCTVSRNCPIAALICCAPSACACILIHRVKARCQRLYAWSMICPSCMPTVRTCSALLHFVRKLLHPRHPG